jgi:hypothetical protein
MLKIKKGGIMPRGDRRGPDGMGPMTGRAMGYCNGFNTPGFTRGGGVGRGFGRGFGRGRGFWGFGNGRGRGFGGIAYYDETNYSAASDPALKSTDSIKEEMSSVEKYLEELKDLMKKRESEKQA